MRKYVYLPCMVNGFKIRRSSFSLFFQWDNEMPSSFFGFFIGNEVVKLCVGGIEDAKVRGVSIYDDFQLHEQR